MSGIARPVREIMAERMALVAEVSGLNARQLRNTQLLGGIEIELLACRRALDETLARDEALRAAIDRDEAQQASLDERLAALDRELAET